MSRSADLSYTYGKYSNVRRKGHEQGHYLSDLADGQRRCVEAGARLAAAATA